MDPLTRRSALRFAGVGMGVAVVGCLDDGGNNGGGTDNGGAGGGPALTDYEVMQFGPTSTRPAWHEDEDATGCVEFYADETEARDALDRLIEDKERRAEGESFVDKTDFDESNILYVASVGPNTCYREIDVRELEVESDRLVGTVAAIDPEEGERACGQAITYPAALIRTTFDDEPPEQTSITVIDGWENEADVDVSAGETPCKDADSP